MGVRPRERQKTMRDAPSRSRLSSQIQSAAYPQNDILSSKVAGSIHWWLAGGEGAPLDISHHWTQGIYLRKAQPNPACAIQPKPYWFSGVTSSGCSRGVGTNELTWHLCLFHLRKSESSENRKAFQIFIFTMAVAGNIEDTHISNEQPCEKYFFLKRLFGAQNFQYRTVWENAVGTYCRIYIHILSTFHHSICPRILIGGIRVWNRYNGGNRYLTFGICLTVI